MNKKVSTLLTAAVFSGLVAGSVAKAQENMEAPAAQKMEGDKKAAPGHDKGMGMEHGKNGCKGNCGGKKGKGKGKGHHEAGEHHDAPKGE